MARSGSGSRFSRGVNSCSAAVRTPTFMNFGSKPLMDILLVSSEDVPYFGLINVRYYVARWSRRRRIDRHRAAYCLTRLGVSRFGLTNLRMLFYAMGRKRGL